jgi:hypothetical protein
MRRPLRKFAGPVLAAVAVAVPASAPAETVKPLPESNYTVRAACRAPAPGYAACLADQLIPLTVAARRHDHPLGMVRRAAAARPAAPTPASGFFGLRPRDLQSAYSLPPSAPSEQVIALVDAYNDVTVEADLKTYDEEFGLEACTTENKCFRRIGQTGSEAELPFPKSLAELKAATKGTTSERSKAKEAIGWAVEISLDVQSAHATCHTCRIVLVEASSASTANLTIAERRAVTVGAREISNSWGAPEEFVGAGEREAFNHPGTVITASAGDAGYREWGRGEGAFTSFPASSPSVVAVGGTRLEPLGEGGTWNGETVWNGAGASGGGCSVIFSAPSWQQQVPGFSAFGCAGGRLANDVSADADPYTGLVIRDSNLPGEECSEEYEEGGTWHTIPEWCTYGGTSLASPIIASVFALAGGAAGVEYPAQTLYANRAQHASTLHDVTSGSNGACGTPFDEETGLSTCEPAEEAAASCASTLACLAAPGYDGPSGVGTPNGILGFLAPPSEPVAQAPVQAAPTPTATTTTASGSASSPPPPPPPSIAVLASLRLTTAAVIALNRRPTTAKVAFAFNSNMATRVRVMLARRVRSHHRWHWLTVGHSITVSAAAGHNVKRLAGAKRLVAGTYRLTLTPSSGKPRSVVFHIG